LAEEVVGHQTPGLQSRQIKVCWDWDVAHVFATSQRRDVLGDLARHCSWHLGRVLTVWADPVSAPRRLPDQLDPVRFLAAFLQTDPRVRWEPRHAFDLRMLQFVPEW
jgi:hypothetical protein